MIYLYFCFTDLWQQHIYWHFYLSMPKFWVCVMLVLLWSFFNSFSPGLCGENGILPIKETMEALTDILQSIPTLSITYHLWHFPESKKSKLRVPTIFWFHQSDFFIELVCRTGLVCSLLYLCNILPTLMQIISFVSCFQFQIYSAFVPTLLD